MIGFQRLSPVLLAALPVALSLSFSPIAPSQQPPTHAADPWWQHAVIYEVYPRSLQDSNGDGIGDINGIHQRLDKLEALGVDAIWVAPVYPSPQVDFGYDISDYEAVDPQYGTLADFDRLVASAGQHHIRVIMDMVLNHTSDQHKWFLESAKDRTNSKADWFVWNDGKIGPDGKHHPPNNWLSAFGGSAWEWVPARGQYYYHLYYKEQPDLNWRNPAVEKAMFDQMRFWLDRGVAGFRLDAINDLLEDPSNADEGPPNGSILAAQNGSDLSFERQEDQPDVHDIIRRMRAVVDSYPGDRVLIGETYVPGIAALDSWYGVATRDELQLPMDTQVGIADTFTPAGWRKALNEAETGLHGHMPLLVIDNHDNPRADRYCKLQHVPEGRGCYQLQKMLAALLFTARDTALFYYGDEIGMRTTDPTRREDVKDPFGRVKWPAIKGRDGERTPMQWTSGKDAGFSTAATTWLPLAPDYKTVNVQVQEADPNSMLAWYRTLIALRRNHPALHSGDFAIQDIGNENVVAYTRSAAGKTVLIALNFTAEAQPLAPARLRRTMKTLASNYNAPATFTPQASLSLPPYAALVAELQ